MKVIRGAKVYDPANGTKGQVKDIWIEENRIAEPPESFEGDEVIDGKGWIVAPGGIEIHTHIAGAHLNLARLFCQQEISADRVGLLSGTEWLAQEYLRLGYTTVMDASMSPIQSLQTHRDFGSIDSLNRGAFTLVGNHALVLEAIRQDNLLDLKRILAWLLGVSGGYALKLVNPGIGLTWRDGKSIESLDFLLDEKGLTQRRLIQSLAAAAEELDLPHPIHLHTSHLGEPGNWQMFCDTVRALQDNRAHLCHIQFYSYGQDNRGRLRSAAREVVEQIAGRENLTFDVGQVVFGPAMVITADLQAIDHLKKIKRSRWALKLLEGEGGMGGIPLNYSERNPVNAVQWATGLELLLRFPDPERLFLTTDFPNGGLFTAYPKIISWLMDGDARSRMRDQVHPAAKERTGLAELRREYSFSEVFAMTSWGPAKALGLADRGHLSPGAVADIRCYKENTDLEKMFRIPELVLKHGKEVIREGKLVGHTSSRTLICQPDWDLDQISAIYSQLAPHLTIRPENYGWQPEEGVDDLEVIPCRSGV